MPTKSRIPFLFFPHIVKDVVAAADYKTMLRFRATCCELKTFTDALLLEGVVRVTANVTGAVIIEPFTGTEYPFFR